MNNFFELAEEYFKNNPEEIVFCATDLNKEGSFKTISRQFLEDYKRISAAAEHKYMYGIDPYLPESTDSVEPDLPGINTKPFKIVINKEDFKQ